MTPRVSVVMPVRDGERFLREALDSTLAQTLDDLELIVVDDGSTDGTPGTLADAAQRDPRVRVERQEPGGLTVALNAGCALAEAALIARMDADDVMLPDRLERQSHTSRRIRGWRCWAAASCSSTSRGRRSTASRAVRSSTSSSATSSRTRR